MRKLKRAAVFHQHAEVDSEGSWAISYGDMITLLLSFFVLYFSTDPASHQQKVFNRSLVLALQDQTQRSPAQATESSDSSPGAVPSSSGTEGQGPLGLVEKLNMGDRAGEDVDRVVMTKLGGKITEVGERVLVEFPEVSFYETAATEVNARGRQALQDFTQRYLPYAGNYLLGVRAYTDVRKIKASSVVRYKDNLELSALRSISAMRVLQKSGIPLKNMRLSGWGEFEHLKYMRGLSLNRDQALGLARKVVLIIQPVPEGEVM